MKVEVEPVDKPLFILFCFWQLSNSEQNSARHEDICVTECLQVKKKL